MLCRRDIPCFVASEMRYRCDIPCFVPFVMHYRRYILYFVPSVMHYRRYILYFVPSVMHYRCDIPYFVTSVLRYRCDITYPCRVSDPHSLSFISIVGQNYAKSAVEKEAHRYWVIVLGVLSGPRASSMQSFRSSSPFLHLDSWPKLRKKC